ncbi:MAG: dihydroorotate dehydrogenase [Lachnospiraceae bacterium]|nr:dihydroorotate dehydrogenase [Lachnospiraceae bacterium]
MNSDMRVEIAGVVLKNPVITASGTFGYGKEHSEYVDLNQIGAITVKGTSIQEWQGNEVPRIAETYGGMLNSIGLQNPGIDKVIKDDIPFLRKYDTKIIINICGHTMQEYVHVAEKADKCDIDLIELNISCPNVEDGGIAFGNNPKVTEKIVSTIKRKISKPLIVKLSPEASDIVEIAKVAEASGADAVSLINTFRGMKIDVKKKQAVLGKKIGGFSGPAIKPIAVRMVYEVCNAVHIPVIGMGGISDAEDALEFIMVGAKAIEIGTANLYNPFATVETVAGIKRYMNDNHIACLEQIRGII